MRQVLSIVGYQKASLLWYSNIEIMNFIDYGLGFYILFSTNYSIVSSSQFTQGYIHTVVGYTYRCPMLSRQINASAEHKGLCLPQPVS
jgi:hypothetical protein